jgi:hypothetical protein
MDTIKTVQSLGDLVYEFAAALILIPKTFVKLISNPRWTSEYLSSITKEKPKLRFEKYAHPIMFWITLGIVPHYFIIETLIQGYSDSGFLKVYNEISEFTKIGGLIIFLISQPIACAFVLHLFKYRGFTRTPFKRSFFIQCYLTVPLQLYYIPAFAASSLSENWEFVADLLSLALMLWFLIAEVVVIRKELNYNIMLCILILGLMYISSFIFTCITMALFFAMNVGTIRKLMDIWIPDLTNDFKDVSISESL